MRDSAHIKRLRLPKNALPSYLLPDREALRKASQQTCLKMGSGVRALSEYLTISRCTCAVWNISWRRIT